MHILTRDLRPLMINIIIIIIIIHHLTALADHVTSCIEHCTRVVYLDIRGQAVIVVSGQLYCLYLHIISVCVG